MPKIFLYTTWNRVISSFTDPTDNAVREVYDNLIEIYSAEDRYHHNLKHIEHMITVLMELFTIYKYTQEDQNACILAAFFHDSIYKIKKPNDPQVYSDEELGAEHAIKSLNRIIKNSPDFIEKVANLIRLTHSHKPNLAFDIDHTLQEVFIDSDMAILGADDFRYEQYSNGIIEEYQDVDNETFISGRKNFLMKLMKEKAIFLTEYMNQLYNDQAHMNIRTELMALDRWYVEILTNTEAT
jgi:predicted metal-dependent HD superfamily phosphohydrolase